MVEKINPRTAYPLQLKVNDGSVMVLPGEVTVVPPLETLDHVEAFLVAG